nr:retrovirus-related Pol polyprotein from transposon TNT 1-94 [Tanacetum cinerariifolium]
MSTSSFEAVTSLPKSHLSEYRTPRDALLIPYDSSLRIKEKRYGVMADPWWSPISTGKSLCSLLWITTTTEVPFRKAIALETDTPKLVVTLVYSRKPKKSKTTDPVRKSKTSKTKSWLWHRRLSHLNFGIINHLAKHSLVRGPLKLKFEKDHLCAACAMGKSKKKPHKPKSEETNQEKLYLLHMDLCGSMRVASVNGKKYIIVIVDDYSRFTWVKCLRSKGEALDFIIKFLTMIQVRLKTPVHRIKTDNGTEFVNQTLRVASLMKHLLLALHSKMVSLKDEIVR